MCDERDEIYKIYATSVRDTMRHARQRPARRKVLTADLSRKILSAPFQSGVLSAEFWALKF